MSTGALDPLIHDPERLRIVATLAALPDGDALSVTRLQDMIGLHTRQPDHPPARAGARRIRADGKDQRQSSTGQRRPHLRRPGRAGSLHRRAAAAVPGGQKVHQAPAPDVRAGDADRDAAAAALGEHFAQGRLTLDELDARLDATLTATTHGELSQAARDLPDLTVLPARVSFPRGKRARPGYKPGPAPGQGAWPHRRGWTRGRSP